MSRRRSITVGGASRDGLTSLGLVATLGRLSSHQRLLRLAIVAGPLLTLAATMVARGSFQPIALMVIGVLAIGCAISPDSHVGLLVVLLLALNWVQTVDDETTPWLLVAAAGLLVLHASMAAATVAPPAARWDRRMSRRWSARVAMVMAATAGAWSIAVGLADADLRGSAPVLVGALAATAWLTWWAGRRSVG
jgi:hypothetical protein